MKHLLTSILILFSISAYSQSWTAIGTPGMQRLITTGPPADTLYRFSNGSYGFTYFKSYAGMKAYIADQIAETSPELPNGVVTQGVISINDGTYLVAVSTPFEVRFDNVVSTTRVAPDNTLQLTAPDAIYGRIDAIYVNADGSYGFVTGEIGGGAIDEPEIPNGTILLANIHRNPNGTTVVIESSVSGYYKTIGGDITGNVNVKNGSNVNLDAAIGSDDTGDLVYRTWNGSAWVEGSRLWLYRADSTMHIKYGATENGGAGYRIARSSDLALKSDKATTITAGTGLTGGGSLSANRTINADTTLLRTVASSSNVDNTSDANKPVSAATQTALDLKANSANPTFTGTITVAKIDPTVYYNERFVIEGDSQSKPRAGVLESETWYSQLRAMPGTGVFGQMDLYNYAVSGQDVNTMIPQYPTEAGSVAPTRINDKGYFFLFAGTNDIKNNTSAIGTYDLLKELWGLAKADGYKIVAFTLMPRVDCTAPQEASRVLLNTYILSDPSLYDYIIQPDLFFTDTANTTYFLDGIHLTPAGNAYLAVMIKNALLKQPYQLSNGLTNELSETDLILNGGGKTVTIASTLGLEMKSGKFGINGSYGTARQSLRNNAANTGLEYFTQPIEDATKETIIGGNLVLGGGGVNLLTYSEQFNNAIWTKSNGTTITANTVTSPDFSITADTFTEAPSGSGLVIHSMVQTFSVVSGTSYTLSIYAKAGTESLFVMRFSGGSTLFGSETYQDFNLATGILGANGTGTPNATITDVGDGWYKCTISKTATASGTSGMVLYHLGFGSHVGSDLYFYIWGAQAESTLTPNAYVRTEATVVSSTDPRINNIAVNDIVTTSGTQTLTNKTLTTPVINGAIPLTGTLDIISDNSIGIGADLNLTTRTTNTVKRGFIYAPHYVNGQKINGINIVGRATTNDINIGFGSSAYYGATQVSTGASATNSTLGGTEITRVTTAGLSVLSGAVNVTGLTASLPVFTDASKNLVSGTVTGTGSVVLATSPTLVTPNLGTPSAGVATNLTGTASGLTAGNVTTNANLTGEATSSGNAVTLTNSAVIGKVLTGYTSGSGTVAATDNILEAIQKLNGNIVAAQGPIQLFDNYVTVGNVGTSETDLATYTIAANRLANNGEKISVKYAGDLLSGAPLIKIYLGGVLIFNSDLETVSLSGKTDYVASVLLIRVSSTIVRFAVKMIANGGSFSKTGEVAGLTLSNTNILKLTGTGTIGTNDITYTLGTGEWKPAAL